MIFAICIVASLGLADGQVMLPHTRVPWNTAVIEITREEKMVREMRRDGENEMALEEPVG